MAEESPRQDFSSESKQDDRSENAILSEESEMPTWKENEQEFILEGLLSQ